MTFGLRIVLDWDIAPGDLHFCLRLCYCYHLDHTRPDDRCMGFQLRIGQPIRRGMPMQQ
jgi:hypothetical protein